MTKQASPCEMCDPLAKMLAEVRDILKPDEAVPYVAVVARLRRLVGVPLTDAPASEVTDS
jgi:hypothetical protein